MRYGYGWRPYVPQSVRRKKALRELARFAKKGGAAEPVVIAGRKIAKTFWGKAWCANLEHYSDYANRLPRGRTYARNGAVLDLQVVRGQVLARVAGSSLYRVEVKVSAVPKARWAALRRSCAGSIDTLVDLLQGHLSRDIMEIFCRQKTGLFPSPREIEFDCSCPDWATMCKHVAAVLYGIGARLDERPELLFALRGVDEKDLVAPAGKRLPLAGKAPAAGRILGNEGLSEMFGIDLAAAPTATRRKPPRPRRRR